MEPRTKTCGPLCFNFDPLPTLECSADILSLRHQGVPSIARNFTQSKCMESMSVECAQPTPRNTAVASEVVPSDEGRAHVLLRQEVQEVKPLSFSRAQTATSRTGQKWSVTGRRKRQVSPSDGCSKAQDFTKSAPCHHSP